MTPKVRVSKKIIRNLVTLFGLIVITPIALIALYVNYVLAFILHRRAVRTIKSKRHCILISGCSTPHGLRTARALDQAGHYIIGVDFEQHSFTCVGRYSRAIRKHYAISQAHAHGDSSYLNHRLLRGIKSKDVGLWIDCSASSSSSAAIAQVRRNIEAHTKCRCVAPSEALLDILKDKTSFLQFAREKHLPAPEFHRVSSRNDIHKVLNRANSANSMDSSGKKYLLQTRDSTKSSNPLELFPRRTLSQTYSEIAAVKVSKDNEMILEEYIDADQVLQTTAIVTRGNVKACWTQFVNNNSRRVFDNTATLQESIELYMANLVQAMNLNFSSHLVVKSCLREQVTKSGVIHQIVPLECSARLTASGGNNVWVGQHVTREKLADAYLSTLEHHNTSMNGDFMHDKSISKYRAASMKREYTEVVDLSADLRTISDQAWAIMYQGLAVDSLSQPICEFIHDFMCAEDFYYSFQDPVPGFFVYIVLGVFECCRSILLEITGGESHNS